MNPKQIHYRIIKIIKFEYIYKMNFSIRKKYKVERFEYESIRSFYNNNSIKLNSLKNNKINEILEKANKITRNEFEFLNTSKKFSAEEKIDWKGKYSNNKLWTYQLNYFDYIENLLDAYKIKNNSKFITVAQNLVNDWIDNTKKGEKNSWEPYPISLRLINWCHLWNVLNENNELFKGFREKMISSIKEQSTFLLNNLEKDLANNHYTANGKCLYWIGITFPFLASAESYKNKGKNILYTQLEKEVLSDGSQYENSTSYQILTAKDYLEVLIYSEKNHVKLPKEFYKKTEKMFEFIIGIMMPNNTLPLLNDSVKNYPINEQEILSLASVFFNNREMKYVTKNTQHLLHLLKVYGEEGYNEWNNMIPEEPKFKSFFPAKAKYIVYRSGWELKDNYLLFDAGSIGPKHNSGHAHADNLNIVAFANGEEIFIDPGTFEYGNGKKRNYYRSTEAHNTISIENENQTTFWGAFRTGTIAKSKLNNLIFYNDQLLLAKAQHFGYRRLKQKISHSREIIIEKEEKWKVIDTLNGFMKAQGKLSFQLGLGVEKIKITKTHCELFFQNTVVKLHFTSNTYLNINEEKSFVSKEWKEEKISKKLVLYFNEKLPIKIETTINICNRI